MDSLPFLLRASVRRPRWTAFGAALALVMASGCVSSHSQTDDLRKARDLTSVGSRMIGIGAHVDAERLLKEAVRLDPKNADSIYFLGLAEFYLGEFKDAEKSFKEALRLRERNPDAHNALGLVYNQMGDHARAVEEYEIALDDPSVQAPEKILLNLAVCLEAMGKTDEAITDLRKAVEKDPKYYAAHYELAKLLDKQDQIRDAIDEYEVAAVGYSADPSFHYRLGLAYFRDHNYPRAKEHLSKVIASLPGSEKAVKAREILDLINAEHPATGSARP